MHATNPHVVVKFSYILFLYGKYSYEIYEIFHPTKISCYTIYTQFISYMYTVTQLKNLFHTTMKPSPTAADCPTWLAHAHREGSMHS